MKFVKEILNQLILCLYNIESQELLLSYPYLTVNQATVLLTRVQGTYNEPIDNIVGNKYRLQQMKGTIVNDTMPSKTVYNSRNFEVCSGLGSNTGSIRNVRRTTLNVSFVLSKIVLQDDVLTENKEEQTIVVEWTIK